MMRKILLLTDIPPCENVTGGIFLNQLCANIPDENLAIFTVLNPALHPQMGERYTNIPQRFATKPFEGWGHRKPRVFKSLVMETRYSFYDLPKISSSVVAFGKTWGAEALWAILEGQTMIRLTLMVSRKLKLPLYPQVMDPPEWWFRDWKVNPVHTKLFLHKYRRVLKKATKIGAASWEMAKSYTKQFGIKAIPIVSPLDKSKALSPLENQQQDKDNTELLIGMAGQLYANMEWDALINALDTSGWNISGRAVKIKLLGHHNQEMYSHHPYVEVLGWRSQQEAISILSTLDVLYLPYWFDPLFSQEARFCFPSKLTSYLAAGVPVFVHSPLYASPAKFVMENKAGLVCDSLKAEQIITGLEAMVNDKVAYRQMAINGHKAFLEHLSMQVIGEKFKDLLEF